MNTDLIRYDLTPKEAPAVFRGLSMGEIFIECYVIPRDEPDFRHRTRALEQKRVAFHCLGDHIATGKVAFVEAPGDFLYDGKRCWRLNIEGADFEVVPRKNYGLSRDRLVGEMDHTRHLENAFAAAWAAENEMQGGTCGGLGLLQFMVKQNAEKEPDFGPWYITNRERMIVAHVMQWLGTNCGRGFLHNADRRAGGRLSKEFQGPQPCPVREFQKEVLAMAETKFPGQPIEGKLDHLIDEAKELREAPRDEMEMADVFLLLLQVAERAGVDLMRAARRKFEIVKARPYGPPDERGVCNHIREPAKPSGLQPPPEIVGEKNRAAWLAGYEKGCLSEPAITPKEFSDAGHAWQAGHKAGMEVPF